MNLPLSQLLKISFVLCLLGAEQSSFAAPQHGQNGGGRPRFEAKQRQIQEMRANRQALRQARQQQLKQSEPAAVQAAPFSSPTPLSSSVQQNQGTIERERHPGFNRLTPEERQALRRQIKEARREIYLQRQQ